MQGRKSSWGLFLVGDRDEEEMILDDIHGDRDGENSHPRGRGWKSNLQRGIPVDISNSTIQERKERDEAKREGRDIMGKSINFGHLLANGSK